MDEPGDRRDSQNLEESPGKEPTQTPAASSPRRLPSSADSDPGPDQEELDPQSRSLSMDSAYGTLSPESLRRELQPQPDQSEGEEEEEEGELQGAEEEEEEDSTSLGSQQSVVQSSRPRRWPRVQPRLHLSRSEDNLLQHFHGQPSAALAHSLCPETPGESAPRDLDSTLAHSRSLSELGQNCLDLDRPGDGSPVPADASCGTEASEESRNYCSDGEVVPPAGEEGSSQPEVAGGCSGETPPKDRKSPAQQHKKLTLAQLYRIRTTLVLNSTLTAS